MQSILVNRLNLSTIKGILVKMARKPIFLDRDGVINEDINPYVLHENQLMLFPWAIQSLKMLHDAGFDIYIISNQQGVAKGMMSESDLDKISQKIQNLLHPHGFQIAKFYYATAHASENHHWSILRDCIAQGKSMSWFS